MHPQTKTLTVMNSNGKAPLWAQLRIAKRRIKTLEARELGILKELERTRELCRRLRKEADDERPGYDYSGLNSLFRDEISLEQSKADVMESASVLAMIPHTDAVDEKAAYCHTIGECLWGYARLLNRIGGNNNE